MPVNRAQIVARGVTHRCPNCGARTLFKAGTAFRVNRRCAACDFEFERDRDEGFYLGSLSLNYGVTIVFCLLPILLLWWTKLIGDRAAIVLAVAGAIGFPILFYRSSRSWWLMNYYLIFPHHLPANGGAGRGAEEKPVARRTR